MMLNPFIPSFQIGEPLEEAGLSHADINVFLEACGCFLDYLPTDDDASRDRRLSSVSSSVTTTLNERLSSVQMVNADMRRRYVNCCRLCLLQLLELYTCRPVAL